jgi:hypothetical protein
LASPKDRIYQASPLKSYVVKMEKEIDYRLAYKKNPSKFIEKGLEKPITKYKI